jgi:hypothetical protein
LIGFGTGLGVYLVLLLGDITINRILAHTPPALARENSGESRNDTPEKTESKAA